MDDSLLGRIRDGHSDAFTEMVRAREQSLLRIAFRIVGNQSDAEDVRQAVFTRIWQRPHSLPTAERFSQWLHRCVVNESISVLRRRQREQRRNRDVASAQPSHAESTCGNAEAESLSIALDQLSAEQRAILALRFDQQLTMREIADVLQQPHTTIHAKLQRAIQTLRSTFGVATEVQK